MKKHVCWMLALAVFLTCLCAGGLAEGERTLSVRGLYHANVINQAAAGVDYNDNYYVKALEEAFGIDFDLSVALSSTGDEMQRKILMCTSGEAPDVFVNYYNINEYYELATQGMLMPLDEYLTEEALGNYLRYVDKEWLDLFRVDGKLYCLPDHNEQSANPVSAVMVRKDLFDQMGIEVPTTLDEFYQMLVKAKEMWPDRIPLGTVGNYNLLEISFNCYGMTSEAEDGSLVYNCTTENFREYLEFMHKLYEEGLIEREYATMKQSQKFQKIVADGYFAQISWWAEPAVSYAQAFEAIDGFDLFIMPYPLTKDGTPGTVTSKNPASHCVMIPASTPKDKADLAIEYLNWFASDEGLRFSLYGVEGINYELIDKTKTGWYQKDNIKYLESNDPGKILYDWFTTPEHFVARAEKTGRDAWYNPMWEIGVANGKLNVQFDPHSTYPKSEEYADMYNMTGCIDYVNEQFPLFISGGRSLDEWDQFQQELKDRGIEELTVVMNEWAKSFQ